MLLLARTVLKVAQWVTELNEVLAANVKRTREFFARVAQKSVSRTQRAHMCSGLMLQHGVRSTAKALMSYWKPDGVWELVGKMDDHSTAIAIFV